MYRHLITAAVFASAFMLCSCGEMVEMDEYRDFSETTESYEEPFSIRTVPINDIQELLGSEEESKNTVTETVAVLETEAPSMAEDMPREEIISETDTEIIEELNVEETNGDIKPKPDHKAAGCIDVPYRSQDDLPTGCELVSTSMLLNYYGFEIEPIDLIDGGYVLSEGFKKDGDKIYGGDPNLVFIGDPRSKSGYGCYSGAIYDGLCRFLEDEFYDTYYLTGMNLNDICLQYIDFGEPVVIWGSIGMEQLYYNAVSSWVIKETGESFSWLSNEHCMVLVGYDDNYYYIHDPLKGAYTPYEREYADMRFAEMGYQAVTICPW